MKLNPSNDFPTIGSGFFSSFKALINPKMNNTKRIIHNTVPTKAKDVEILTRI